MDAGPNPDKNKTKKGSYDAISERKINDQPKRSLNNWNNFSI